MDKGTKIIIFKDKKAQKIQILSQNLKRAILEKRLVLLEDEYDDILTKLEKGE
jgi:hypothetical protein